MHLYWFGFISESPSECVNGIQSRAAWVCDPAVCAASAPTLQYNHASYPHAVSGVGTNSYLYDPNGNQTRRTIGSDVYDLGYDAENRLVEVKKNSVVMATFVYDGDGQRVKSLINGTTTYFLGNYYEKTGTTVTKYYYAGSQRVAMRKGSTRYYLLSDHLGSTSMTVNSSGTQLVETRYKPWGEVRYVTPSSTLQTRYTFTGQYSYVSDEATDLGSNGFGLMFYNARWYDPALGRFAQADKCILSGVYKKVAQVFQPVPLFEC